MNLSDLSWNKTIRPPETNGGGEARQTKRGLRLSSAMAAEVVSGTPTQDERRQQRGEGVKRSKRMCRLVLNK